MVLGGTNDCRGWGWGALAPHQFQNVAKQRKKKKEVLRERGKKRQGSGKDGWGKTRSRRRGSVGTRKREVEAFVVKKEGAVEGVTRKRKT